MVNSDPSQNLKEMATSVQEDAQEMALDKPPTVLRCVTGALISVAFTIGLYFLTTSIHQTLDATPITSDNPLTIRISALVRSLVIGMGALGTITFGVTALGLTGLAIQLLFTGKPTASND